MLHSPLQKLNKAKPTLALNPKEMSPEIQNRGSNGPKIGHVNASAETLKKQ